MQAGFHLEPTGSDASSEPALQFANVRCVLEGFNAFTFT